MYRPAVSGSLCWLPAHPTLVQSLRPFPQFGNIPVRWSPLGNSWYDSLQLKGTKRYSHGSDCVGRLHLAEGTRPWSGRRHDQRRLQPRNQKNISPQSIPFIFVTAINYRTPALVPIAGCVSHSGWTVNGRYSALSERTPDRRSDSAEQPRPSTCFAARRQPRAGQPLFLKDLNCHCFDPSKELVLNPAPGPSPRRDEWGTSAAYYNDYRSFRRPSEQFSLGAHSASASGCRFRDPGHVLQCVQPDILERSGFRQCAPTPTFASRYGDRGLRSYQHRHDSLRTTRRCPKRPLPVLIMTGPSTPNEADGYSEVRPALLRKEVSRPFLVPGDLADREVVPLASQFATQYTLHV